MSDQLLLAGAVLLNVAGFGWLALAMDAHWKQVRGSGKPTPEARIVLRVAGGIAFLLSFPVQPARSCDDRVAGVGDGAHRRRADGRVHAYMAA